MSFLVNTLTAKDGSIREALEGAYVHIAGSWITSIKVPPAASGNWERYSESIRAFDAKISITPNERVGVHGGKWAAVELLNCLNHMDVLLRAVQSLGDKWTVESCAPTQQSFDDTTKERIADLQGKDPGNVNFVLEGYGGVNYRNNGKLALDLLSLHLAHQRGAVRLLLAARKSAWGERTLEATSVSATCGPQHGKPFSVRANVRWLGTDSEIAIAEISDIQIADRAQ